MSHADGVRASAARPRLLLALLSLLALEVVALGFATYTMREGQLVTAQIHDVQGALERAHASARSAADDPTAAALTRVRAMATAEADQVRARWRLASVAFAALTVTTAALLGVALLARQRSRPVTDTALEPMRQARASERRARALARYAGDVLVVCDGDGCIRDISGPAETLLGRSTHELAGLPFAALIATDDRAALARAIERARAQVGTAAVVDLHVGNDIGARRTLEARVIDISQDRDVTDVDAVLVTLRDVTESRALAQQLVVAQKMEAVGRLAGGVAHDFNNLLTVILGTCAIAINEDSVDPRTADFVQIKEAAHRAAALTRQLLAFSRKQVLLPEVFSVNELLKGLGAMLKRLIGEDIDLALRPAPELGAVRADPGQIEQAVVNLVINARDALPMGGKITIETADTELDAEYARQHPGLHPGPYVLISVADTGVGMTPEVLARIFEPFYTTKDHSRGTGLGLSTVHGIVRQSGGHISVYSVPARGSVFKIYLPRVDEAPSRLRRESVGSAPKARAGERVLVIEDDEALRRLTSRVLRDGGYQVTEAPNGEVALDLLDDASFALVVSDVIMPGVMGRHLEAEIRARSPDVRILFTSGYTDEAIVHHGVLDEDTQFLQKPFTPAALLSKVHAVLTAANDPVPAKPATS